MAEIRVTSTDFREEVKQLLEQSGKAPVFITEQDQPVRVLLDIAEYKRLKACDDRDNVFSGEMPEQAMIAYDRASSRDESQSEK